MGRHHVRIYSELPQCELVAVIDKDVEKARKLTEQHGGVAVERLADVPGELDAVTVAVPTVYHAEVAIPLLERGVSVLVEKPLAPDTLTGRRLVEAARASSGILQVGSFRAIQPGGSGAAASGRAAEVHRDAPDQSVHVSQRGRECRAGHDDPRH